MQTLTEIALGRAARGVFTRQEAACWINTGGARLNALLKRAVGSGELLRIVRGLYCLDTRFLRTRINPLELAQRVQGPSYISLESALSYHGWIPEAVYTVTSTSLERSRTFDTPLGVFSYTRVPQSRFYSNVSRIGTEDGGSFLMAEPLKAGPMRKLRIKVEVDTHPPPGASYVKPSELRFLELWSRDFF